LLSVGIHTAAFWKAIEAIKPLGRGIGIRITTIVTGCCNLLRLNAIKVPSKEIVDLSHDAPTSTLIKRQLIVAATIETIAKEKTCCNFGTIVTSPCGDVGALTPPVGSNASRTINEFGCGMSGRWVAQLVDDRSSAVLVEYVSGFLYEVAEDIRCGVVIVIDGHGNKATLGHLGEIDVITILDIPSVGGAVHVEIGRTRGLLGAFGFVVIIVKVLRNSRRAGPKNEKVPTASGVV